VFLIVYTNPLIKKTLNIYSQVTDKLEGYKGLLMIKLLSLLLLFIFTACDAPMRTRVPTDSSFQGNNVVNGQDQEPVDPTDPADPADPAEEDLVTSTPGFENCAIGPQYYGGSRIGSFGLCQSTINESSFKLKMASSDLSQGTCFIPLKIVDGGNSYKVGIAECVHNEANKVYPVTLTKDRSDEINGVMVIKAGAATNAYMNCMSAKNDYILSVPNCQYSSSCISSANQYANYVCGQFVGTYSTFYTQVSL
jgi:hypothetical protein